MVKEKSEAQRGPDIFPRPHSYQMDTSMHCGATKDNLERGVLGAGRELQNLKYSSYTDPTGIKSCICTHVLRQSKET